jgi:hypothetical protein
MIMDELTALKTLATCTTVLATATVPANLNPLGGFVIFIVRRLDVGGPVRKINTR